MGAAGILTDRGNYDERVTRPSSADGSARRWVSAAVGLLLVVLATLAGSPPAHADDPIEVAITLTSVSPQVVPKDPAARIMISGEVVNTSKVAMKGVQVSFWRSRDPISTTAELQQAAASPWDVPFGERMGVDGTEPDLNLFNITTENEPSFGPGAKATFTVSARVDQLDLGSVSADDPSGGVRLVGVHVRGTPAGGTNHTVGRARVFMPMSAPTSVDRASIVVLTSAPSMLPDGTFTDTHLAGELGGRLGRLLAEAAQPGATVLIDPSLYDELTAMTSEGGYRLSSGQVTTEGAQQASDFLLGFGALQSVNTVYRLPFGNPDLALAHQFDQPEVVSRAAAALPANHPLSGLPVAVVPDRSVDSSIVSFIAPLHPTLLVLRNNPGPERQQVGDLMVVRTDTRLGLGGPGPAPSSTDPQRVGRALSELLLDPSPQIVTLSDQVLPAVDRAIRPLSTLVPLTALEASSGRVVWPNAVKGNVVSADWWAQLDTTAQRLTDAGDLRGDLATGKRQAAAATSRAAASRFTAESRVAYLSAVRGLIPSIDSQNVRIVSAEKFVVSEATTRLPITVTNNTDQPVAVRVVFISENPQRISLPPTDVVTVPPHGSHAFTFTVEAHTNGALTVRARLETSTGVPVGVEHRFILTANSLGRIGWILMVSSGLVVLAATALRIRQVRGERGRASLPAVAGAPSGSGEGFVTPPDLGTRPHP
ncbi:DUF6049 family protein [Aestuariimicrobium sp. T2.26MG-19.2B]|uniref:DUF6049 family protein n=1 Tax=Aestuariimicrobium sp. T2.26MG-19.2B TaxID=3040679 RepID=UPI0024773788|nr:DUF6049 family protein [Aestuariimicrobium sp. T2.26MG-19.2B]CAI9403854.1 hypothetical protein AESSP_01088 [Aestuariimicrobium sp. T2.26MG-19.2B]